MNVVMTPDLAHTCIATATTIDGRLPAPCPACSANLDIGTYPGARGVIVRTMRELHPSACQCTRCCPWARHMSTGTNIPPVAYYYPLADVEEPPAGLRFPGT